MIQYVGYCGKCLDADNSRIVMGWSNSNALWENNAVHTDCIPEGEQPNSDNTRSFVVADDEDWTADPAWIVEHYADRFT